MSMSLSDGGPPPGPAPFGLVPLRNLTKHQSFYGSRPPVPSRFSTSSSPPPLSVPPPPPPPSSSLSPANSTLFDGATLASGETMAPTTMTTMYDLSPVLDSPGVLLLQSTLVAYGVVLGALLLDVALSLPYDVGLVFTPGWRNVVRAASRSAYLLCRWTAIMAVLLSLLLLGYPHAAASYCDVVPVTLGGLLSLTYLLSTAICALRTLALYPGTRRWDWLVWSLLGLGYVGMLAWAVALPPVIRGNRMFADSARCAFADQMSTVPLTGLLSNMVVLHYAMLGLTVHKVYHSHSYRFLPRPRWLRWVSAASSLCKRRARRGDAGRRDAVVVDGEVTESAVHRAGAAAPTGRVDEREHHIAISTAAANERQGHADAHRAGAQAIVSPSTYEAARLIEQGVYYSFIACVASTAALICVHLLRPNLFIGVVIVALAALAALLAGGVFRDTARAAQTLQLTAEAELKSARERSILADGNRRQFGPSQSPPPAPTPPLPGAATTPPPLSLQSPHVSTPSTATAPPPLHKLERGWEAASDGRGARVGLGNIDSGGTLRPERASALTGNVEATWGYQPHSVDVSSAFGASSTRSSVATSIYPRLPPAEEIGRPRKTTRAPAESVSSPRPLDASRPDPMSCSATPITQGESPSSPTPMHPTPTRSTRSCIVSLPGATTGRTSSASSRPPPARSASIGRHLAQEARAGATDAGDARPRESETGASQAGGLARFASLFPGTRLRSPPPALLRRPSSAASSGVSSVHTTHLLPPPPPIGGIASVRSSEIEEIESVEEQSSHIVDEHDGDEDGDDARRVRREEDLSMTKTSPGTAGASRVPGAGRRLWQAPAAAPRSHVERSRRNPPSELHHSDAEGAGGGGAFDGSVDTDSDHTARASLPSVGESPSRPHVPPSRGDLPPLRRSSRRSSLIGLHSRSSSPESSDASVYEESAATSTGQRDNTIEAATTAAAAAASSTTDGEAVCPPPTRPGLYDLRLNRPLSSLASQAQGSSFAAYLDTVDTTLSAAVATTYTDECEAAESDIANIRDDEEGERNEDRDVSVRAGRASSHLATVGETSERGRPPRPQGSHSSLRSASGRGDPVDVARPAPAGQAHADHPESDAGATHRPTDAVDDEAKTRTSDAPSRASRSAGARASVSSFGSHEGSCTSSVRSVKAAAPPPIPAKAAARRLTTARSPTSEPSPALMAPPAPAQTDDDLVAAKPKCSPPPSDAMVIRYSSDEPSEDLSGEACDVVGPLPSLGVSLWAFSAPAPPPRPNPPRDAPSPPSVALAPPPPRFSPSPRPVSTSSSSVLSAASTCSLSSAFSAPHMASWRPAPTSSRNGGEGSPSPASPSGDVE